MEAGTPVPLAKVTLCAIVAKIHVTVPPTAISTEFGVNWESSPACTVALDGNCGAVTVTVASANRVASAWAAARMSATPGATPVTRPVWSTVATEAAPLLHTTCFDALLPVATVAVSWLWFPTGRVRDGWLNVTERTSAVASTRMVAAAVFDASKVEVAVMLTVPGATALTTPVALTVALAALLLLHVTVVGAPPTAVTVALSCEVVPTIRAGSGAVTVIALTAGLGFTVMTALPDLVASTVEVAVIVALPTATAVTTPAVETVATLALELVQATEVAAPPAAITVAVSARVSPTTRVAVPGVTATEVTDGGGGVTVTDTDAALVGSPTEVAVILAVPVATPVTTPEVLTLAMVGADEVQVTAVDAPPVTLTVAMRGTVAPTATDGFAGAMATEFTAGRGLTVTTAEADRALSTVEVAVMVAVPTATPVTSPAAETVATPVADEVHDTVVAAPLATETLTVSCEDSPTFTETLAGVMLTAVTRGVVSGGGPDESPPPQAAAKASSAAATMVEAGDLDARTRRMAGVSR
jgi:hypothetical protein